MDDLMGLATIIGASAADPDVLIFAGAIILVAVIGK